MYKKKIQSWVHGSLLKLFDDYCRINNYGESEGIRECFKHYNDYISGKFALRISQTIYIDETINTEFKRQLQSIIWGNNLKNFNALMKNLCISESDLIRESIRIKVLYDKTVRTPNAETETRERKPTD